MKLRPMAVARLLGPVFSSRVAQSLLFNASRFLNGLQGIGSGDVFTSRELEILFRLLIEDSPIIFDVGAHTGEFLQPALRRGGARCIIHAFEPSRLSFSRLSEQFGNISRVHLNQAALTSMAGSGVLFYDEPGSQLASLNARRRFTNVHSEGVRLETLDAYCQMNNVEAVHLLKLDVEGHELEVLEGGEQMLNRKAIHRILFEFGGCHVDSRVFFRDIYDFLSARGMTIARLSSAGLHPVERYREDLEQFQTTNYLATLAAPEVYSS